MRTTHRAPVISVVLAAAAMLGSRAQAQSAPSDTAGFGVAASRLASGRWTYRLTISGGAGPQQLGERLVTIDTTSYGPIPALVLAGSGGRGALASIDSLVVGRSDLQPLHYTSVLGLARQATAFTADSVYGASSSPAGRQNIVAGRPRRLVVSEEMLDALLRLEPLAAGWHDSVSMLVMDPTAAATAPLALAVEGEERITGPAGAFDCWIVSVQAQRGEARLWVSKQGQIVVRSEQALPDQGAVLIREITTAANGANSPPAPTPEPR